MPTRKFRELLEAMPADRQRRIEKRFQTSLAAMPLDQLRKAQEMTQLQVAEILGVNQGEVSKIEHRSDICISAPERLASSRFRSTPPTSADRFAKFVGVRRGLHLPPTVN